MARKRVPPSPFRYFNSSPEVIRLVVMMCVNPECGGPALSDQMHCWLAFTPF